MLGYKSQSILAMVLKRSGNNRHHLHHDLHNHFRNMNINTNETFSMRLEYAYPQATQSRDAPGRLGFVEPFSRQYLKG